MSVPEYSPGEWYGVIVADTAVLLDPRTPAPVVREVWTTLRERAGLNRPLEALLVDGISGLRPFAAVRVVPDGLHTALRGEASIVTTRSGTEQRRTAPQVVLWTEDSEAAADRVELRATGTDGSGETLPVTEGVVRASRIVLDGVTPARTDRGAGSADAAEQRSATAASSGASGPASGSKPSAASKPSPGPKPAPAMGSGPAGTESPAAAPRATAASSDSGVSGAGVRPASATASGAPAPATAAPARVVPAPVATSSTGAAATGEAAPSPVAAQAASAAPAPASAPAATEAPTASAGVTPKAPAAPASPAAPSSAAPKAPFAPVAPKAPAAPATPQSPAAAPQSAPGASPVGAPSPAPAPSLTPASSTPAAPSPAAPSAPTASPAPSAPVFPAPVTTAAAPVLPGPASEDDHDGMTILSGELASIRQNLPSWAVSQSGQFPSTGATPAPAPAPGPSAAGATPLAAPAPAPDSFPRVALSTGVVVPVDGVLLIGRAPQAARAPEGVRTRTVAVPSPTQDISRTHAEVRVESGRVLVTDLFSTNGITVSSGGLPPRKIAAGEAVAVQPGEVVDLGDGVTFTVEPPA
ncbi:FHA domain-containing protein [Cellulomonas sp. NPDC089187]|uniref:FHA domain-containing protein n=1 Tax=Cellulomonas sp. NPDC089187 TaxID=3154970 RepID=UPI0034333AAA